MIVVRPIDRKRWRRRLTAHLEDFARQLEALRYGAEQFGPDFDLAAFEKAFSSDDPALYSQVLVVERAFGRLQNFMAAIAEDGARLAELPRRPHRGNEPKAAPSFEALRDADVIPAAVCQRVVRAQKSRSLFEHDYVAVDAADVHVAVKGLLIAAPGFIKPVAAWLEPFLTEQ